MEQDKNKETSFESRETNEREQTPLGTQEEEALSAREAARRELEAILERARRKKEICNAYGELCSILDDERFFLKQ